MFLLSLAVDIEHIGIFLSGLAAVIVAWRRYPRMDNGQGKKEPIHTVLLKQLIRVEEKVDGLSEKMEQHLMEHDS